MPSRHADLQRIEEALTRAADAVAPFTPGAVSFREKEVRGDPLTEADLAVNRVLRDVLPSRGEGWLSEESVDDPSRVGFSRCWIVDPIDGTREFVEGLPEWCISIGLVEDGRPVAGGILNPATGERVTGSVETGVRLNGEPVAVERRAGLAGSLVLASRSEVRRGEWARFDDAPFEYRPCGSVAYKLALVAAGKIDATWTLVPKHEWDVAAGAALVQAAGLRVVHADGSPRTFNRKDTLLPNFLAGPAPVIEEFRADWL